VHLGDELIDEIVVLIELIGLRGWRGDEHEARGARRQLTGYEQQPAGCMVAVHLLAWEEG